MARAGLASGPMAAWAMGAEHPRAVQGQQDLEGRAHGFAIVGNKYGPVGQAVLDIGGH